MDRIKFQLDVNNAIIIVWMEKSDFWHYSFTWLDGSCSPFDEDWQTNERTAKESAKYLYESKTHSILKRAKWLKKPLS